MGDSLTPVMLQWLLILALILQPILKASQLVSNNVQLTENEDKYAYDTSLLWKVKPAKKTLRFDVEDDPSDSSLLVSTPNGSLTEPSPTSVDGIFKNEEFKQETAVIPEITKEWIEAELIPLFKSGQMISKELIQKV